MPADDHRQPWWLWASGAACLAVVAFAWSSESGGPAVGCSGAASFIGDVWQTPARSRLQTRDPDSVAKLDALADAWTHERLEVCHGAQAGADKPARWSARRRCLERWAERFDAAVEQADAAVVTVGAVASVVQSPQTCRSAAVRVPLPADPTRLAQALSGRRHLSAAEAWIALGVWDEARTELAYARRRLQESGYPPLQLEAQLWEAAIPPGNAEALIELGRRATAIGETTTAARALALATLLRRRDAQEVDDTLRAWTAATVERSGDPIATAWWGGADGADLVAARAQLASALGPDHALVAETLAGVGSTASR